MHRQERWLDCTCLKKNFCPSCRESPQWPPKQMASRQALLGKDTHSGHWAKLACSGVAGTTLLITVNCQDRLMSGGHGFKLHRSRRCWLHHCIRQKAARKNVGGLPAMPSLVLWKWIIIQSSLSLFELFGLSFARTGKNGDLIARASRKKICSNCRESPQWPPKQMASRQALLGKDILDTEPGVAGTTLLITVNCQDRVMSGGHGFKLYRSRRCWLHHCIRQKAARKNVGGLPAMPSFVFWKWIII